MQESKIRLNQGCCIISDIHLDNWPRCSPEKDFRMRKQPLMLAKRISQVMREKDTDYLFLLGDIINQWSASPQIMGVLVDFYRTLIEDNPNIYIGYIVGQHDIRLYDDYSEDNSYVHLVARMFPDNVHYMHDKSLEINGTSVYFSSYNRRGILYPKTPANIFLSHISFGFVEVDTSCADLIVAGDIHDFYDSGNCHSVGLPYQLYAHQPKDGVIGYITLDGKNSRFERLKSDSQDFEFLKLDPIVRRKIEKDSKVEEVKIDSSDIMKMIEDEGVKHGVLDIHKDIPTNNLPTPISFSFQLKKLIIDNVRSIDHLELDLENLAGINFVRGPTGAGKSTIFYSIITALVGAEKEELVWKTNKFTGKPLRLQLWLDYEGHEYYIDRSVKETKLSIDGVVEPLGKRDTQKRILEVLPFAMYWKFFYIKANRHYFDSIDKTELMRVLFNLKIFDYLFAESKTLLKANNAELKRTRESLIEKQSQSDTLTQMRTQQETELEQYKGILETVEYVDGLNARERSLRSAFRDAKEAKDTCQRKADALKTALRSTDLSDATLTDLSTKLAKIEAEIDENIHHNEQYRKLREIFFEASHTAALLKNAKVIKCPKCGTIVQGATEEAIKEAEDAFKKASADCDAWGECSNGELFGTKGKIKSQIESFNKLKIQQEELTKLEQSLIELSEPVEKAKNALETFYAAAGTVKSDKDSSLGELFQTKMTDLKVKISKRDQLKSYIQNLETRIACAQQEIFDLKNKTAVLEQRGAQIVKYNELFDIQNLQSIPYSILSKLVSYLNTDKIKFESSLNGEKFNLTASIQVGEQSIAYEEASDGQKNYLDMFILIRITRFLSGEHNLGLVIMDEPLSNLDPSYVDEASQLIPEIAANSIFISSHTRFDGYDRVISVKQDERGLSEVTID